MTSFVQNSIISGIVTHGKKLWRTLWFPTLNINAQHSLDSWTYKVRVRINNQLFSGMAVWFQERNLCEVHCFGMQGDNRYDQDVDVTFIKYIRPNQQFSWVEALTTQLYQDKLRCENNTIKVMTFGSFDVLHAWHLHYLTFAAQQWDHLLTVVASDASILRFKSTPSHYSQSQRIDHINASWVQTTVVPWSETDYFAVLKNYQPDVLVFGYDQNTLHVEQWYTKQSLALPVFIQAPSYHPERYKSSLIKASWAQLP